jgi:hypothetical protein
MNRKLFVAMLAVALVTLGLAGYSADNSTPSPASAQDAGATSVQLVRFFHAYPEAEAVDIYLDDSLLVPEIDFGEVSPRIAIPAGDHQLTVRRAGLPDVDPAMGEPITIVAPDDGFSHGFVILQPDELGDPVFQLYTDNLAPSSLGNARVLAIHAIPEVDSVDIVNSTGGALAEDVTFGEQFGGVDPPAGSYDLLVGSPEFGAEAPVAEIGEVEMMTNTLYTFVVYGMPDDIQVTTLSTPLLPNPNLDTVQTNFANATEDGVATDLYLGETLIVPGLQPGEVTHHVALPVGVAQIAVREAGSPADSDAAAQQPVSLSSPTGATTITATGSLGDGTLFFFDYANPVDELSSEQATLQLINGVSTGPANVTLSDGTTLADGLSALTASGAVSVVPDSYSVADASVDSIDGPIALELAEQDFVGGTFYTLLVYLTADDEAGLNLAATPLDIRPGSLPGTAFGPAPVVAEPDSDTPDDTAMDGETDPTVDDTETTDTELTTPPPDDTAGEVVATTPPPETTEPPAAVVTTPPPTTEPAPVATQAPPPLVNVRQIIATVNLNPNVNMHCREYPSADAASLVRDLIPNNSELVVEGYAGPPSEEGVANTPVEEDSFEEPTEAEEFENVWLRGNWVDPNGNTFQCWFRADLVLLSYRDANQVRRIDDTEDFFGYMELEIFPPIIEEIPYNFPGGPVDLEVAIVPPTPFSEEPVATVDVGNANLKLRRTPSIEAETLWLLPTGSQLTVIAKTEIEADAVVGQPDSPFWIYGRYTSETYGFVVTGWISAQYVTISQGGDQLELEEIPEAEEIFPGTVESGTLPDLSSVVEPTPIIATVNTAGPLNMRDRPSNEGAFVVSVPPGSTLTVLGRNGNGQWINVRYQSGGAREGWVPVDSISITQNNIRYPVIDLPITSGDTDTMTG